MRRKTDGRYPGFVVWENVQGAFSSGRGEDFRCVLEALCRIKDAAASVSQPPKGKWNGAGEIVGDGYSVAWRTLDAQYWGVPQRRKRIYIRDLVLDQLEEDGELEEARILKALELSHKERVYDLEEVL